VGPAGAVLLCLVFNVPHALFAWPAGWLSDRVGRRRVLAAGFGLYALVYAGLAAGAGGARWGVGRPAA